MLCHPFQTGASFFVQIPHSNVHFSPSSRHPDSIPNSKRRKSFSNPSLSPMTAPRCFMFLVFLLLVAPPSSSQVPVEHVDVRTAKDLIASGNYRYLDVRTAEEFYDGYVKGAINIPYIFFSKKGKMKNIRFLEQVSAIYSKDDFILVGCSIGLRSINASEVLINAGFKHVKNIDGGYEAWVKNGFSVVERPRSEL